MIATLAASLPSLISAWLWFGVAWMMLCRLRRLGPESRRLVNISLSLTATGALGQMLATFIPFSLNQLRAIDLALACGLFGMLLSFSPQWSSGAPEVTRRR